jgi:hypothetical protein
MVMTRELCALLTITPFRLPNNPGNATVYERAVVDGKPVNTSPLTCTEQASINLLFNQQKRYYMLMQNIKWACFTALDASVNDAFNVSNIPNRHQTSQTDVNGMRACR